MSQYGNTQKNPPWVRSGQNMNVAQSTAAVPQSLMAANSLQTAAGMLQYPPVFQGQQMYGTVSYPTRALNTAAFQQGQQQGGGSQTGNRQQRVFTGTVTKAQDNFGFVDEDVFFQSSCCVEGSSPQVGDSVLVEAVYNANMPIKWNATRIQVLKMQDQRPSQNYRRSQSNYNAVPPPKAGGGTPTSNRFSGGGSRFSNATSDRGGRGGGGGGNSTRRDEPESRKRRRDDRDKDDKAKSPPRKRSKSPNRQTSRRPRRPVPRYSVSVPKINLNTPRADVVEIKKRYPNMYVPSDFFLSMFRWTETFPIGKPVSLDFPCAFHVMHKDVDNVVENDAVLEPPDADYLYSAKVMLMASPGLDDLYSKCVVMAEDREGSRSTVDEDSLSHPSRLIHFLVGTRGKENMAIGGPWSPSLDGADPVQDPGVLVKTAIRTTLALTGIDLSNCTQWFRFVEVHYHRGESVHRGKSYPARVETVVIFVPDVWSCVPTRLEWDGLQLSYQKALARKINDHDQKEEEEEVSEKESQGEGGAADKPKKEPKHFSELDPKNMKVSELREELEARCLSPKGLKSQLAARLAKTIKTEEEEDTKQKPSTEEESGSAKKDLKDNKDLKEKKEEHKEKELKEDEKKQKEEEEPKKLDEKEKQLLEKRYKLPKKPSLLVHPSRTAKSGKFDCHYYSLSILLGYRQDDTKEHSFEVSIFAELFNEMLMRDFGFNIYRAIVEAPEKPKEEKKEEKEKDKTKDEKEKPKDEKEKPKDDKEKPKEDDKEKEIKKEKDTVKESKEENKESSDSKQKLGKVKDEEMDVHSEPEEIVEDDKEEKENKDNDKDKKGDKEPRRERAKLITLDKELLLSFIFFDTTRCGYIYDKDIEDLLFSLGLTLSRSQVRKLVSKIVSRDAVYYRRLTDRPEGTSLSDHMTTEQLIAFKPSVPYNSSHEKGSPNGGIGQDTEVKTGQVISFNGTLVDIGKLMEQLTRSETARIDTEKSLGKLREELSKLKETTSKSEKYIKDLNADVRDYRDRLSQTSSELSTLQVKERQYMRTLNEISEKIRPLIAKPEPKPEPEIKEIIDLEDKGEEPMAVDDK